MRFAPGVGFKNIFVGFFISVFSPGKVLKPGIFRGHGTRFYSH